MPSSSRLFIRRPRRKHHPNQNEEEEATSKDSKVENTKPLQHQCSECNITSKVKYRALVSDNGSYLCDTCYKVKFPATAMCDMNQNQNILVRKYNEYEIRKTQNKLGKNSHGNIKGKEEDLSVEEEECCSCLDKGIYRKCCKKYYCHLCYYNQSRLCPGCGASVHQSGVTITKSKPTKVAVLATWGVSLYIIMIILGIAYLFVLHNLKRPETVWKNACYGWFPKCDRPVCIDVEADSTLMPIQYNFCSINNTVNRVIGKTCIVDPQLYHESDGLLGHDLCITKGNEALVSPAHRHEFEDGVYVFEDNFDYWKNDTDYSSDSIVMKSARWSNIANAKSGDICGFNSIVRPYEVEMPPTKDELEFKRPAALVFSGVQNRFSETIDLDVRFGGRVEFYLKMAPIVENELATECKSSFGGDVNLLYSLDQGISWSILKSYPVLKYRSHNFSFVTETIPIQAQSNHTRFRWEQPVFDSIRDFWALDDIRIFHQFEQNWRESDWFSKYRSKRWLIEQQEQCCLDTEQCLKFPNYASLENCNSHSSSNKLMYRIKIVDMFIIAAMMISLAKKACHDFQVWFEDFNDDDNQSVTKFLRQNQKLLMLKKFQLNISKSWQISAFITLATPFLLSLVILSWHMSTSSDYYDKKSIQTCFYFLALGLDFWTLRSLSSNVLQFWPCHTPPRIEISQSYDQYKLWIDNTSIDIMDIGSVDVFSQRFYYAIFACVIVSSFPLATISILIKILQLKFEIYIVLLEILGCSLILRSVLGPLWFVIVYLSATWIFASSTTERDKMGRAMERPSVRHVVSNCMVVSVILYIILVCTFKPLRHARLLVKISIFFGVTITSSILGSLIGILRGLPIAPNIRLTTWPNEGYSFVNERCIINPHTWARLFGGGMNSFQFVMMQVKRNQEFRLLISGSSDFEDNERTMR